MRAVSIKTVILISLGRNSSDSEINTSDYLVTDFFPHIFIAPFIKLWRNTLFELCKVYYHALRIILTDLFIWLLLHRNCCNIGPLSSPLY